MFSPFIDLLLLIVVANGTPLVVSKLLDGRMQLALDFGYRLPDQQPLLGPSKTWRGLLGSLLVTAFCAWVLGYPPLIGFWTALISMLGDAGSSFIKRRLGKPSSSPFLLLDQVPESLLPALVMADQFSLGLAAVFNLVLLFTLIDLALSRSLLKLRSNRRSDRGW
ncbi:MAG: CDP-archaeol synthase [Gammaproteobacteria bacterium]|nr:CDP-archaeol synthase [Gammaproteobacteria bacterium]